RIALVAALAVVVMGGVVASALVARSHAHDDPLDGIGASGVTPAVRPPTYPLHGSLKPMPSGCEFDPASPPAAVLDVPDKTLNLGLFKQGEKIERKVTLRNTGSGVLCVSDIETSCGRVKADWGADAHLAPGAAWPF